MSKKNRNENGNVRRIPPPILADVDAMILEYRQKQLDYRKQQAEAKSKQESTRQKAA